MEVDEDYQENRPAPAKAAKGAKAKTQPLQSSHNENVASGKAIEEIYQKKTQLEHILLRPDTYIGSTEKQQQPLWVHDGQKMVQQTISFVPGLYKIFDEILVNAADNKVRDPSMDTIKVEIDAVNNSIQVWNNGDGVPVEVHKEEAVYVPELIFGHLLTSSNYDDNEKKITGGRNGYGAKLANIFSTEFTIETCDGKRQRRYRQVFKNNMSTKGDPKITSCKPTDNWTSVTFKPDLVKFGMDSLDDDTVKLMRKRVYDLAGILGKTCKVFLNGERLGIKSFQDYVDLYLGPKDNGVPRIYEKVNERWEVCISITDGQFNQVSFVNSICTIKGGTHVNYIVDQITKNLVEKVNKKHKNANVKPFMVKNHLWVFINSQIENPAFDSQTKETLTLRASSFGSKCDLSDKLLDKILNCGLRDHILQFAEFKNSKALKKSDGAKRSRLIGITKLDDANNAGGRNSHDCTLILTEGDSAKALAMAGVGVVGRDNYGVFPLRGKLLNVREASAAQISTNTEIQNIKQILGLQHGKKYEDAKSLRYGHLMIMTDQDHDGSHIKGLIMNYLHTFYPSLLQIPGFLLEFITPIVKATKGKQVLSFYTMPEYENWKQSLGGTTAGWDVKYYKGLGTSTAKEGKEYFARLNMHRKEFIWSGDHDGQAIEMAFSKKKIEERKAWLSNFVPGTFLDQTEEEITYSDFINKELILFSRADLERSIPSMVDGFKPGQRKIMFCCFKRNLKKDIKVGQLGGYVAEHSAYHHGDTSLQSTIIGMAQNFLGSNNINLLVPSGQFGTRAQGGKDAASARYIFTRLSPLARHLFNENDDCLLSYLNEEGQSIEPSWYMPILPMVLVNGAEGIGTGWSTSIPNYNPLDIVANIRRLLAGQAQEPMHPWYNGFTGTIAEVPTKSSGRSYLCSGTIAQISDTTLDITELPVRKWTQDYKEFLEGLIKPEDKEAAPLLDNYNEHHSDVTVHFTLELSTTKMTECVCAGLESKFKLTNKFSTSNMMLFDRHGLIKHYESPEAIIQEFFELRLEYYERRRQAMIKSNMFDLQKLSNRVRFILGVINGSVKVNNRKKANIEADLDAQGFDRMPTKKPKSLLMDAGAAGGMDGDEDAAAAATADARASYEYLLSMPIHSLTAEKVSELQQEAGDKAVVVEALQATNAQRMWTDDLDSFEQVYSAWLVEQEEARMELIQEARQKGGKKGKGKPAASSKAAAAAKKKKTALDSDEDEAEDMDTQEDSDFEDAPAHKAAKPRAKKPAAAKPAAAAAAAAPAAAAAKPAAAAAAAAAKVAAKAAAPSSSSQQPSSIAAASDGAAPSEPLSLAARLAGRMQTLSIKPSTATAPAPAAAAPAAATTAAPKPKPATTAPPAAAKRARKPIIIDDDDEDDLSEDDQDDSTEAEDDYEDDDSDCVTSPAPKPKGKAAPKVQAAAAAAKPAPAKAAAAAKQGPAAVVGAPPPAAAAPAATNGSNGSVGVVGTKAAAKRKPRGKKVVVSSDEESEGGSPGSSEGHNDVYDVDVPSPAVAPKGKKSKVGPSPLHIKAVSKTAAAGKKLGAAAAAAATAMAVGLTAGSGAAAVAAAAAAAATAAGRPQRARRPVNNISYVEIQDSDEDVVSEDGSSEFSMQSDADD